MIYYNFCFRGPYEYDKFILNYLQFSNEVKFLKEELKKKESINEETDSFYRELIKEDNNIDTIIRCFYEGGSFLADRLQSSD